MGLKQWWNKDKDEIKRLNQVLQEEREQSAKMLADLEQLRLDNITLQGNFDEYKTANPSPEDYQASTIPWFTLSTKHLDEVKGLQVELDWNEAMVQHLKDNGHTGRDDEILIQKWIAMLYEDMVEQLEHKIINLRTNHSESEFQ